jgi:hypothetical protein
MSVADCSTVRHRQHRTGSYQGDEEASTRGAARATHGKHDALHFNGGISI